MLCEYKLQVRAICPADQKPDIYQCVVRASRTIEVETILAAVVRVTNEPLFQEKLTNDLHRELAAEVETVGSHSGVETKVICK